MPDDPEEIEFWRRASSRQRGQILLELLELVDAMGRYPEKSSMFPGWKTILAQRSKAP
jgi:hypothetical protein